MTTLFTFICAAIATFVLLGGLFQYHQLSDLIIPLIILPLPLHLLTTLVIQLSRPRHTPPIFDIKHRKFELLILFLILLTLTSIGLKSAHLHRPAPPPAVFTPMNTPAPAL